ncbi:MAG: response regulator [Vicinamibacterales bacterium]
MDRVLFLDADADSRELYAEFFRFLGYGVRTCDNADDAEQVVREADVLVTGIGLAGRMDGVEFVRALRQRPATCALPIVVVSAHVRESDRERARRAGCDLFLPKPCLPEQLVDGVRHVRRSRSGGSAAQPRQGRCWRDVDETS